MVLFLTQYVSVWKVPGPCDAPDEVGSGAILRPKGVGYLLWRGGVRAEGGV